MNTEERKRHHECDDQFELFPEKEATPFTRGLLIVLVVVVAVTVLIIPAFGQDGHGMYHEDYYSGWTNQNGSGCCNNQDCKPAEDWRTSAQSETGYEVNVYGTWCEVRKSHIVRGKRPPDGGAHACVQSPAMIHGIGGLDDWCSYLLCFQPGTLATLERRYADSR